MSAEPCPSDLLYHAEHGWARIEGDLATFGITAYAQESLGELVAWDGPSPGARVQQGESYGELESVKAVSDVIAPLSGEVVEINEALAGEPAQVNESPYGDGWLVRVRTTVPDERDALLDAAGYRALTDGGEQAPGG